MANHVTDDFGTETERYEVFVGTLDDLSPGEEVAVGISLLDKAHILTGEKTGYDELFVRIHDPSWSSLVAEEYSIPEDCETVNEAVADAIAKGTERYLRHRIDATENVVVEELPTASH